jgi:hypothetical protein
MNERIEHSFTQELKGIEHVSGFSHESAPRGRDVEVRLKSKSVAILEQMRTFAEAKRLCANGSYSLKCDRWSSGSSQTWNIFLRLSAGNGMTFFEKRVWKLAFVQETERSDSSPRPLALLLRAIEGFLPQIRMNGMYRCRHTTERQCRMVG